MSALLDALQHPVNRPRPLVEWLAAQVNPSADLRGLEDGGGVLCDFRPGFEEKDPSLSVNVGQAGAVFKRFGADGFEGGALAFVASCLNVTKGEAARLLIERAGLVDTPPTGRPQPTVKAKAGAAKLLDRLGKLSPLEDVEAVRRLRGWVKIEAGEDTPEHAELARRGLTPALGSGLLTAYRFTGKYGGQEGGPQKRVSLPGHILPGAVAFEVRGPDEKTWAVKVRNPGSKEDLEAAGTQRYVYLGRGQSTPAWCSPGTADAVGHLIVEGELNGAACALMLEAVGYGGTVAVQGVASAEALPHVSHIKPGADVWLYADADPAGDKARKTWAGLLSHLGAKVYQIGQGGGLFSLSSPDTDACDALGTVGEFSTPDTHAAYLGARLMQAMQDAPLWVPPQAEREDGSPGEGEDGDVWLSKRTGYGVRDGKLCALTLKKDEDTGEEYESREVLAEFTARIVSEVSQEDGTGEAPRVFEIEGTRPDGRPMRPARVKVTAADFAAMNWPVKEWGAGAVVHAGQGKKDKARVAIQMLSTRQGITERTVYQHTGWTQHEEHGPLYLTAGAVIGAGGAVQGVDVELSGRLSAYALPDPGSGEGEDVRAAVRASLDLLDLAPDAVAVPVLGAVYRAPLGPVDAAVWLTGETGRNKTAFLGLAQSHYGARWGRHFLPDGWNSTANALESSAFRVKDAVFLIDDFKPSGAASDVAKAQGAVSRILQGVADGQGRSTLTADRKARAGLYPRGLVMSSSETQPRGHSNRARAVIVDVTRPLIGKDPAMSAAYYAAEDQAGAGVYARAQAAYVRQIAGSFEAVKVGGPAHRARVRELAPRFEGQHGRTGTAAAELAYGWEVFLSFAAQVGAISEGEAEGHWARVVSALEDTAQGQGAHLSAEDPVARALAVLSGLLAQGRVFLEDLEGGPPPEDMAVSLGWQAEPWRTQDAEGVTLRTRPRGELVGWYAKTGGDEWGHFLPEALHEVLQRAVTGQGGAALPDAGTLWGNMRDRYHGAGLMRCEEEKRGGRVVTVRPCPKVTVNGERLRLLTLRLPLTLPAYGTVGAVGALGADGEERTSDTVLKPAPINLFFKERVGTVGAVQEVPPSSFAVLPAPDADPLGALEEWEVSV